MALVHKLYDGTNTIDLTASTGLKCLQGFLPKTAMPTGDGSIPPYIVEEIPVRVVNTTADNMAADLQKLALLAKRAAEYWVDQTQTTPVWYHQQQTAETGERRALVKSIALQFTDPVGDYLSVAPAIASGRSAVLFVERHPYWESTSEVTMNSNTPTAGACVVYDYSTTDVVGDVGARINLLSFEADNSPNELDRLWIGVRGESKRTCNSANLVRIWECEDGTNNASETGISDEVDATASGGDYVLVDETDLQWDDTFQLVLNLKLSDVLGGLDETDQFGDFLWLLRAKVASASTWEVAVAFGYSGMDTGDMVESEYITVDNTNWDFYEIGTAPIPLRNLQAIGTTRVGASYEGNYNLQVWARRTSGHAEGDDLCLDCFCTIPIDEGFCYIEGADLSWSLSWGVFATSPKDDHECITHYTSVFREMPSPRTKAFYLPPGDGRMYVCYARSDQSVLADTVGFNAHNGNSNTGKYTARWTSLRGAE